MILFICGGVAVLSCRLKLPIVVSALVLILFMALLSFRGIITPSLPAQGEQRRSSYFNIQRGNPIDIKKAIKVLK
jgi:hypothetical protein